jgi:hypothetical protein
MPVTALRASLANMQLAQQTLSRVTASVVMLANTVQLSLLSPMPSASTAIVASGLALRAMMPHQTALTVLRAST